MIYEKILKKFVPIPKIEKFDSYLFIGPHPDDIEVGNAPFIAKLVAAGKKVAFVVATDGRIGTADKTLVGEKLVKIRQAEAMKSAELLNVSDVKFLGFPDGGPYDSNEMTKAVAAEIIRVKPDVVFAPDFKTRAEYHADHTNVGRAAVTAAMMSGFCGWTASFGADEIHSVKAVALYFTDKPNAFVKIKGYQKMRGECLKCFKSQFRESDLSALDMYFGLRERALGFAKFKGRAEGYRVLAPAHMHCLPEASKW